MEHLVVSDHKSLTSYRKWSRRERCAYYACTLGNNQPRNLVCQQSMPEYACISFCLLSSCPMQHSGHLLQHVHPGMIAGCRDGSFLTTPDRRFRAGVQLSCLCCCGWSQWLCSSAALSGSTLQGANATHANQTSTYCSWH